jgi:hypothetical protein
MWIIGQHEKQDFDPGGADAFALPRKPLPSARFSNFDIILR